MLDLDQGLLKLLLFLAQVVELDTSTRRVQTVTICTMKEEEQELAQGPPKSLHTYLFEERVELILVIVVCGAGALVALGSE